MALSNGIKTQIDSYVTSILPEVITEQEKERGGNLTQRYGRAPISHDEIPDRASPADRNSRYATHAGNIPCAIEIESYVFKGDRRTAEHGVTVKAFRKDAQGQSWVKEYNVLGPHVPEDEFFEVDR